MRLRGWQLAVLCAVSGLAGCSDGGTSSGEAGGGDWAVRYSDFLQTIDQPTEDDCQVFRAVTASVLPAAGSEYVRPYSDMRPTLEFLDLYPAIHSDHRNEPTLQTEDRVMLRQTLARHTVDFRECSGAAGKPFVIDWPIGDVGARSVKPPETREGFAAVLELSPPGYTEDHKKALVYAVKNCGGLCGQGGYFWLERIGAEWVIVEYRLSWIS